MQIASVLVALGGDKRNTVPKTDVTPAEVAVLMAIHGDDAVFDIRPGEEEIDRSNAEEIENLRLRYRSKNEDGVLHVDLVYPGRNPVLHQSFDDLGIDETLYAASAYVKPPAAKKPATKRRSKAKNDDPPVEDEVDAEGEQTEDVMS